VETLLFIVLGAVAVAAAAAVVLSRNPVHSALFLLLNFVTLAIFYVVLNAQFLAVAQVTVYAGAIIVLFLLIGGEAGRLTAPGRSVMVAASAVLSLAFLAILAYGIATGLLAGVQGPAGEDAIAQVGNVQALGQSLYTDYLLPVQLVAVLLLVGMVGAVVLAKRPKA